MWANQELWKLVSVILDGTHLEKGARKMGANKQTKVI